jgi:hypothetical protein
MQGLLKPVGQRREQPTHLLKFRNMVYGFDTAGPGAEQRGEDGMEVDAGAKSQSQSQSQTQVMEKGEKKKKRKSDGNGDTPKKKKVKAA